MEAEHATTSSQPPVLLLRDPQDIGDHGSIPGTADRPSTAELVERAIASNHAQKEAVAAQLDRLYSELEQLTDALVRDSTTRASLVSNASTGLSRVARHC